MGVVKYGSHISTCVSAVGTHARRHGCMFGSALTPPTHGASVGALSSVCACQVCAGGVCASQVCAGVFVWGFVCVHWGELAWVGLCAPLTPA